LFITMMSFMGCKIGPYYIGTDKSDLGVKCSLPAVYVAR
jgi:hypothetical protein